MKKYLSILSLAVVLASCGSGEKDEKKKDEKKPSEKQETIVQKKCSYTFDINNTSVRWVAYKTGEKVAVSGRFDDVAESGAGETSEDATKILKDVTLHINALSINSQDTTRDGKLKRHFFGSLNMNDGIYGKILSMNNGKGTVLLGLNGAEMEYDMKYSKNDATYSITVETNVNDFAAQAGILAINEVCKEKHTGPNDTSPVTWPDVKIVVETTLIKDCE